MKKLLVTLLIVLLCVGSAFAGGDSDSATKAKSIKIGVLVSDVSGEEAIGFRNYYTNYLASQYDNVTFIYSDSLDDAAAEKTQIERFAAQNCDAIISFAAGDRAAQVEACESAKIYYAIATGMMDDADYEKYKGYKYFVGQIGPSMNTEYEAGLAMGKYYKDVMGYKNIAIYGAFIPNPMHSYRIAGALTGLGLTYDGASGKDIVAKIGANFDVSKVSKGSVNVAGYIGGYYDEMFGTMGSIMGMGADALLSVGMSTTFFADMLNGMGKPYSDIDAFTEANGNHMVNGTLNYLAGKYASSIGPIFAATISAVNGAPIRDNGNAISIGQGYWVAKTGEEYVKFQAADTVDAPIFTKELLDTVTATADKAVSYEAFKALVEADRTPR